jgi:cysteine desulfurase
MSFYFDHNATTPISAEVLETLNRVHAEFFGNPSSIHSYGQAAREIVEEARREVSALLDCDTKEVVFTSGGTESDNLALFGVGRAGHVVTSTSEHPAVLSACKRLESEGVQVSYVPVSSDGLVDPESVRRAMRPGTALVSIMHANNETGTVQPIREIAAIARQAGVLMHSDGVQVAGRERVSVRELGVDLYSISGHKLCAPKGVGALYVRRGLALRPMLCGGRHERERRAGTENVGGIAALGRAAKWMRASGQAEKTRLAALRDRLESGILERVPSVRVNGESSRTPNTTNLAFQGVDGEAMVIALDLAGFAVSTGAACSSGAAQPSHVLLAMGLTPDEARSSLRFSLGRTNNAEQVDALVEAVAAAASRLRKLSPTYTHV